MIRKSLLYLLLFSCCCAQAQQQPADSLLAALNAHTQKDTVRVNLYYNYAFAIRNLDMAGAMQQARKGIALSREINWTLGEAKGFFCLSDLYAEDNVADSVITLALASLNISEKINNRHWQTRAHLVLAEEYRILTHDSLAEYHANVVLKLATELKDRFLEMNALATLAVLYAETKQPEKEKEFSDKALKLALELNDEQTIANTYDLKARRAVTNKNYTEALHDYRQVLAIWEKMQNYHGIAWIQVSVSDLFLNTFNKDSARYYAYAALKTAIQYDLKKETMDAYDILYRYHYQYQEYKKALEYRLIYDSLDDATYNIEVTQNAERTRLKYEQEKKDAIAKVEQDKKDSASRKARNLQYALLALFMILVVFLIWNNRRSQKAKREIELAYSRLQTTQKQLVQSEKMASLGELTAGIAHEIQNPLNFVNNFSEVNKEMIVELKEEIDKGNYEEVKLIASDIEANEEKINHHGKRADAIVKGMLQHSRSGGGQKELADINALTDEYLRLSYHGLRAKDKSFNATFHTDFDAAIGKINIVPQDIGRVIMNLLTNAFYAVDEKKKLIANSQQLTAGIYEPTVLVKTKKEGSKILISVTDNGNGIPASVIDKIFQPFFTTKPTGQGTGLGLSMSYDIIKAHGGELKVSNRSADSGGGALFIIELPA